MYSLKKLIFSGLDNEKNSTIFSQPEPIFF